MKHATLKQLRVFAAVAQTGSVTAAARALHVSPPAVTLQMRLLQEQVGLALVERSARGMVPTEAGRVVQETLRGVEAQLADCSAALAAMAGSESGCVRVGVVSTAKYVVPRVLAAFARLHPGIELRLLIGNRAEVMRQLVDHEIDLAVMGQPPDDLPVAAVVIGDHPHVIIAAPEHHLACCAEIRPAALAGERFLVREAGSGTRVLMESFFAAQRIKPRVGMEIGSNEAVKQAVMAGLGIAFLSAHTVEIEIQAGRLAVVAVAGLPLVRQWFAVWLSARRLMPAATRLASFFGEQGAEHLPRLRA